MVCYRFAGYWTPLRVVPASESARYSDAEDTEPTQYLALHPLGPLAELMRRNDLRHPEQIRAVRTRTWALHVNATELPEISFENAESFGISAAELVSDDHGACQKLARALRLEMPAVIVPSAALPGTRNLVLFGPRVAAPYLTAPTSALDIPASITADDGRPLLSLLDIVRFQGSPHAGIEAWQAGTRFDFAEPDWAVTSETLS